MKTALKDKDQLALQEKQYVGSHQARKLGQLDAETGGSINNNNARESKGPIEMHNGAIYTGEWQNNMKDGHG